MILSVGLVARPNPTNLLTNDLIASGFVLLAAVCVALGSVLVQRIDRTISTEAMVAWSNALGAVILHLVSAGLPSESVSSVTISIEALSAILYLAVFASAIGYFIYFDLLVQVELTGEYEHSPAITADNTLTLLKKTGIG